MSEIDYVVDVILGEEGFDVDLQLQCDPWAEEYVKNRFHEENIESTIREALDPLLGTTVGPHTKHVIKRTIRAILDEWVQTI